MQAPENPFGAALAPLSPFYAWQSPGGQFSVYLSLDVVKRLGALAAAGPRPEDGRRAEVGGLLLGRTPQGATRVTVVEGFEPFPSAHVRGPSYTLVGAERRALASAIRRRGTHGGLAVVGWFRSHSRPGLFLDQQDFSILSEFFTGPGDVCLLIGEREGTPVGGFFVWEEGDMRRQAPYSTFPFDAQALAGGGYRVEREAPGGAERRAAAAPVPPHTAIRSRRLLVAVAAVVALVLAMGMLTRWVRQRAPQRAALSLGVEKSAGGLKLTWNREAAAVRHASGATVRIDDGGQRQNISLTPRQLALGSMMYFPSTGDVGFEMAVGGPGGERTEAVRAVSAPEVADANLEPSPFPPEPAAAVPAPAPFIHTGGASRDELRDPAAIAPAMPVKPAPPLPETVWAKHHTPANAAPLQSPPTLRPRAPLRGGALSALAPPAPRQAEVFYEPAKPSGITGLVGKVPLLRRLRKERSPDFVAARPVRQVKPAVPAALAPAAPIEIKVHVDESGRVMFAEVPRKDADSPLVKAAADAALEWRFTPARVNGKDVPSDVLLRFQFE